MEDRELEGGVLSSLAGPAGPGLLLVSAFVGLAMLVFLLAKADRARRQAEARATEHQAITNRLAAVLNAAHSSIIGLSREGWVVLANLQARQLLGDASAMLPLKWPEKIAFADRDTLQPLTGSEDPVLRAAEGEAIESALVLMRPLEGSAWRHVRLSSAPVLEDGALGLAAVLMLDDVTEQERARVHREQAARLDALGGLTGGIAQDFNNLLAATKYAVQMAEAADAPEARQGYFSSALKLVARGGTLTQRLLAFAKRQPGVATSRPVEDVLRRFETMARPLVEDEIALEIRVDEDDLYVFADAAQLETALLNLVLNARDAILRAGQGGQITVGARSVADVRRDPQFVGAPADMYMAQGHSREQTTDVARGDGRMFRYVELSVTDDGPGMDEATKRQVVDPFFTTAGHAAGKGLGLSVVYGFIQQANGILRISSQIGQGSCIRLLLPRGTAEGPREAPVDPVASRCGRGQTILIVEDSSDPLGAISDVVSSLGFAVQTVASAHAALEVLKSDASIDVMMADIVMPGDMGGLRLAEAARQVRPSLPILYMTGYAGMSAADMERVVAPVVQKPCPPGFLAKSLDGVLSEGADPQRAAHEGVKTTIS
ncbi:MAG: ATP-binding protein [Paracoccaceae bacterium]